MRTNTSSCVSLRVVEAGISCLLLFDMSHDVFRRRGEAVLRWVKSLADNGSGLCVNGISLLTLSQYPQR